MIFSRLARPNVTQGSTRKKARVKNHDTLHKKAFWCENSVNDDLIRAGQAQNGARLFIEKVQIKVAV